jgi:hypothetical protein
VPGASPYLAVSPVRPNDLDHEVVTLLQDGEAVAWREFQSDCPTALDIVKDDGIPWVKRPIAKLRNECPKDGQ